MVGFAVVCLIQVLQIWNNFEANVTSLYKPRQGKAKATHIYYGGTNELDSDPGSGNQKEDNVL